MNIREQRKIRFEKNITPGHRFNAKLIGTLLITMIAALVLVFGVRAIETRNSEAAGNFVIRVPGDYSTIQAAIDAAGTGDIIQVGAGVYNESITINKPISLVAESFDQIDPTKNNTIIDGGGRATTIVISAGLTQMPTIRGFVIRNGGDGILSYSEFISEYNYLYSASNLTSYQKGGGGINRNNVYFNASHNAIRLDNMDRSLLIQNNRIMYSGADGIEISLQNTTAPPTVLPIVIQNNMILGNSQDGIHFIDHPGDPQNTNRLFMIAGNLIANNQKAGLGLMPNANAVEDYSGADIAEAVRVFNNTFYGNNYGISGGGNLVAFNNIIANSLTRGTWRVGGPQGTNSVVAYSMFHNNIMDAEQSILGAGIILGVDPLFEAAPNPGPDGAWRTVDDDFSGLILRPDSPAIDKGVAQYTANNGELIPPSPIVFVGAAPDLGWRELGAPIITIPTSTPIPSATPPSTTTPGTPTPPTTTVTPGSSTPTATTSSTTTVTATPTPQLAIQNINPISAQSNTVAIVTITGTGFQNGAVVTFEGGQGQIPTAMVTMVVNPTTIMAVIDVGNSGASGAQVWDVRVTNPDTSTAVLPDAFTVTPS